ncbi:Terpene synthase [Theobroma cacao]|nr:Terpene synthase [Theobroma cacao]
MEEYMSVALIASGYLMLPITSYVGMGDHIMKEAFNWASNTPKSLRASMTLGRLMDDIASHKFEQEIGHVGSAVECYMKQHGVSEQEAYSEFHKHIDNAWKYIDEELLNVKAILKPVLIRILNFSRVIDALYKDGEDRYTNVVGVARSGITSLLIDPISV